MVRRDVWFPNNVDGHSMEKLTVSSTLEDSEERAAMTQESVGTQHRRNTGHLLRVPASKLGVLAEEQKAWMPTPQPGSPRGGAGGRK